MAPGFVGVTGPWHFEFGFKLGADDGVEGVIRDVQGVLLLNPLAQGGIGGKTCGLPEGLLQGSQHAWRE